jgi:hypothetical protein|eukprot:SAG25_NODE_33_length_20262_cov_33.203293_21_plen_36_part_00
MLYDPHTQCWSRMRPMGQDRAGLAACALLPCVEGA